MEYALQIQKLTKTYESFALEQVDLALPQGCIMGLVGENGAGKSTLIKAALDLIRRDSGCIQFYGEALDKNPMALHEIIGVVFDTLCFYESLTLAQIDRICAGIYQQWNSETYRQWLERFSLPHKEKIKALSKGMKMKLNLAVALSHNAKLLILDEPTSGLDPIARDELMDVFLDFVQDETHSILFSTHITTDLERIADYITFLHKGRVVFTRSKDALLYDYGIVRCGEAQFIQLAKEPGIRWRKMEYQYEILVPDQKEILAKYPGCAVDKATIDEIMLLHVKGETK